MILFIKSLFIEFKDMIYIEDLGLEQSVALRV